MKKIVLLIAVGLVFGACATSPVFRDVVRIEKKLNGWIGQDTESLFAVWGEGEESQIHEFERAVGRLLGSKPPKYAHIYAYRFKVVDLDPETIVTPRDIGVSSDQELGKTYVELEVTFYINEDGIIQAWRYRGDGVGFVDLP